MPTLSAQCLSLKLPKLKYRIFDNQGKDITEGKNISFKSYKNYKTRGVLIFLFNDNSA